MKMIYYVSALIFLGDLRLPQIVLSLQKHVFLKTLQEHVWFQMKEHVTPGINTIFNE